MARRRFGARSPRRRGARTGGGAHAARESLAELACARLDDLERTMRHADASDLDVRGRLALEQVVTRVSVDLDAAAELLELSERAEHAVETELTFSQLVQVSLSGKARGSDREVLVRVVELAAGPHAVLRTDPHVFKRLVAFSIARVHAAGATEVSVLASCGETTARVEIGPTRPDDRSLAPMSLRLVSRIGPTDAIVEAAARSAAIAMTTPTAETIVLEVPRVPSPTPVPVPTRAP